MNLITKVPKKKKSTYDESSSIYCSEKLENLSRSLSYFEQELSPPYQNFIYFKLPMSDSNETILEPEFLRKKRNRSEKDRISQEDLHESIIKIILNPQGKLDIYESDSDLIKDFLLDKASENSSNRCYDLRDSLQLPRSPNNFAEECFNFDSKRTITEGFYPEREFLPNENLFNSHSPKSNLISFEDSSINGTRVSKSCLFQETKERKSFSLDREESFPIKNFLKEIKYEDLKKIIFKNIKSIASYSNLDLEELQKSFSSIYKHKLKKEIENSFKTKGDNISTSGVTTEMSRKDELDKKVNTIMKSVLQILLNLLFNYSNIEEILTDQVAKKLIKKITLQKMTKEKVDVKTLREFHSKSLKDIYIENSLITNIQKRKTDSHVNLIINELRNKTSFHFLFDMKFEVLLNLIFLEFFESEFAEIHQFLAEYSDNDPNKAVYEENLQVAFYERLNYITADDIIPNNRSSDKRPKKTTFKTFKTIKRT